MHRPSFTIYDASAGSGKTYTIVKEYLKIILTANKNDAYRNILAITFTNKAVHEMKSRIVGSLSEFVKEEPNQKALDLIKDLSKEIKLSEIQIKNKAKQIIKHLIHNYAAFDISTIDKFTHKVIRAFAHDLNLPLSFEVTLDTDSLLLEAVDAIIAQAGENEILTKLLIDFTLEKTDNDKSWDISREILETGRLALNENNRNEIVYFHDKSIEDFIEIKNKLTKTCEIINSENEKLAFEIITLIDNKGINVKSFPYETFPKHLHYILTKDTRESNHKFINFEDIKIKKGAKDQMLIESIIMEMLSKLSKVYHNNEKKNFYKAFIKNITPLSLLNTVNNELNRIQKDQNILSIAEFNSIIHREIQNQPAPFIYERLGERYRHFFIDEFQDTSEMQWQNLIPLIDNAISSEEKGEKGTLMIVGDPKQSIYRWRGGKAEQFIALSNNENPFNNPEKTIEHLYKNYRSYSEIIEFNNGFFTFISTEFENHEYKDLYENHSQQITNDKNGGYVNISFLPIIEKTTEEDTVTENSNKTGMYVLATLKTIQKVINKGFDYKDIVILTRKRSQGITLANFLTEQNIPILSSETLMIQNSSEVRLIVNLLKYFKNPFDLLSKAYFLEYLAQNNQKALPIHDFIAQGMDIKSEFDFELWLNKHNLFLSFHDIRKKSLYEMVETIVYIFLNLKRSNAYIQYFLDIVLERDIRNQAGISDFLNYWDKNAEKFSIPSPEGNNALRIMTIHKSKGLEFPVVIIPFAEEDYNHKPKDKLWLNAEEADFGLPKVLIDNSIAVEGYGENAKTVFDQKKQEELLDNINVLYVALTRAEEQLYIISQTIKLNKTGLYPANMASFFIKYLNEKGIFDENKFEYEFGSSTKESKKEILIDTSKTISQVTELFNPNNIKIAKKSSLMWGTHQQKAIEFGNVVHEILSWVKTKNDIDIAITKAIEKGLITFSQKGSINNIIQKIVCHPELESFFSEPSMVLNEQIIIQKESKAIKPDRIVISNKNEVFLLDYKTGDYLSGHKSQLENYQNSIEKMGYKVVKKTLIYIGEQIDVVNL